jgi:hypothetical protein
MLKAVLEGFVEGRLRIYTDGSDLLGYERSSMQ